MGHETKEITHFELNEYNNVDSRTVPLKLGKIRFGGLL